MSSEFFCCVREKEKQMIIKNKNAIESLPSLSDAPPLRPDGGDRPSARPRRMLSEREVLEIIPFSRATLYLHTKSFCSG
jgi:hypothetical protein